jgi:hypothetical protein
LSIVSSSRVRIIVLVPESETEEIEQNHWSNLTTDQFLSGYSPADAIYDKI